MGFELRLRQKSELDLRLEQKFGDFERDLWDTAEFQDIDIENPKNAYHRDMLQAILLRSPETGTSLIGQILREQEDLREEDIDKIIVESFQFDDIDLDLGTKRNVDRVVLVCKDMRTLTMTVSIDKARVENIYDSPTMQETNTIQEIKDPLLTWAVQKWYGTTVVKDGKGIRAVICKEYVPGTILNALTLDLEVAEMEYGEQFIRQVAYAVGKMIANVRAGFDGIPIDSNPFNIIIDTKDDGNITARYCDVERILTEPQEMNREISLIKKEFGKYAEEVERGIKEG
ncbi:MAG: hypothetical protein AAB420_03485 [Patescibacteria group bacterium]